MNNEKYEPKGIYMKANVSTGRVAVYNGKQKLKEFRDYPAARKYLREYTLNQAS